MLGAMAQPEKNDAAVRANAMLEAFVYPLVSLRRKIKSSLSLVSTVTDCRIHENMPGKGSVAPSTGSSMFFFF